VVCGGAGGSGTEQQDRRLRVPFPVMSLEVPLTYSFRQHYGPGVNSASNKYKYQEQAADSGPG
jgi:hypothetical protein